MSAYTEINVKENMPTVPAALQNLKASLDCCRRLDYHCVLIIHGYGSRGMGGVIRDKARQWLRAQERNKRLKTVIEGEEFNLFNPKAREMKTKYRELDPLIRAYNHGVTVIEL